MIENFSIFKAEKKNDKAPDYNISAKVGDKYENIGACWLKDGKSGKYFSCKLSGAYENRPGYHIEIDLPKVEAKTETPKTAEETTKYTDDQGVDHEIPF